VEQAVGTFISSETVVENHEVLSDRIYSKAEGYVAEYKVLREKDEGHHRRSVCEFRFSACGF